LKWGRLDGELPSIISLIDAHSSFKPLEARALCILLLPDRIYKDKLFAKNE